MIKSELVATRTPITAQNGLVVGGHEQEAEAGVRVLKEGGNAVDALVAAAFTGFVVEPGMCGLGGYGRMAIFWADDGEFTTIDHYVRAPREAHADMFELDLSTELHYYNHPKTVGREAEWGYRSPAVPGSVAGLCAAHDMFGRLPLPQVLEPAVEIAEQGIPVTWDLLVWIARRLPEIRTLPGAASVLLKDGNPPAAVSSFEAWDTLVFPGLSDTLQRIAEHGPAGFYSGPVAEAVDREIREHGGILTAEDLAAYRPRILREPPAVYRDYTYVTAFDPLSYETLNILDEFDLSPLDPNGVEFRHLMAEAMGHAFVDNMVHYGDPDYTESPVNGLSSRDFAAARAAGIRSDRAASRPISAGNPWPYESEGAPPQVLPTQPSTGGVKGTSQMVAADRQGNVAALITSLTSAFGSLVYIPEAGFFLNNGMQNFDPRPDHPNCIVPGKMPIFAAPTLVAARDGRAAFGIAGSGGYRIMTGVLHSLINAVDFGMEIQEAVDSPRVHCQGEATYVDSRIPEPVQKRLEEMGHRVVPQEETPGALNFGRVNAIRVDPNTGLLHAGSGPAWSTAAAGY